jgi:hypothetical protein
LSGVDPCSNIIPEDYYFESECDKKCMCESRSLEEYFECSSACYRSKVGSILDDYPTD